MPICALCLRESALKDSHLVPKAAYRIIGKGKFRKTSPILLSSKDGRAVSSDKQVTKHLLCGDCEQRFSDKENVISKYWFKGNGFLLRNQLRQMKIYESMGDQRFFHHYPPIKMKEDDCYYFFVSILWRATCGPWPGYDGLSFIQPHIVEKMRRYLLGEADSPDEIRIILWVDWDGVIESMMTLPMKDEEGNRALVLLLGMFAEIHIDDGGRDSWVPMLSRLGNKVWLVLDKKRCKAIFNNLARITQEMHLKDRLRGLALRD